MNKWIIALAQKFVPVLYLHELSYRHLNLFKVAVRIHEGLLMLVLLRVMFCIFMTDNLGEMILIAKYKLLV